MSLAWGPRLTAGSLSWSAREASESDGIINGSADVLDAVERDLALAWMVNGGVESDLNLLWQVDAEPITAVESDLQLTWNVIVAAGTTVERDLTLLWQRGGSVQASLYLLWQVGPWLDVAGAVRRRRKRRHALQDRGHRGWKPRYEEADLDEALTATARKVYRGEPLEDDPPVPPAPPANERDSVLRARSRAIASQLRVQRLASLLNSRH